MTAKRWAFWIELLSWAILLVQGLGVFAMPLAYPFVSGLEVWIRFLVTLGLTVGITQFGLRACLKRVRWRQGWTQVLVLVPWAGCWVLLTLLFSHVMGADVAMRKGVFGHFCGSTLLPQCHVLVAYETRGFEQMRPEHQNEVFDRSLADLRKRIAAHGGSDVVRTSFAQMKLNTAQSYWREHESRAARLVMRDLFRDFGDVFPFFAPLLQAQRERAARWWLWPRSALGG